MNFTLTLVASLNPIESNTLSEIDELLNKKGITRTDEPNWLEPYKAVDIHYNQNIDLPTIKELRSLLREDQIDVFITEQDNRKKSLLIADMDSTIVQGETLDELAAEAGIKDKIAPITDRAMRGELDFKQALIERVYFLKNVSESLLENVLNKTTLNPGAQIFVQTMKSNGAASVLVSGGFTVFTDRLAKEAGFDFNHGNLLQIENNKLTGEVEEPVLDKDSKVKYLYHYAEKYNLSLENVLAIGDGANDLPMLQIAGLGIGYKPKPLLENELSNCIIHGDLSAALYAQGYTLEDISGA